MGVVRARRFVGERDNSPGASGAGGAEGMDQGRRSFVNWRRTVAAIVAALAFGDAATAQTDAQVALAMGNSFYANNATYTDSTLYAWPTDTPAHQGLNASVLAEGSATLANVNRSASFLVVRGGKLVHESYFHNALPSQAKNIHSASKSILSTLVGIAIDEGHLALDTRLGEVLPHSMSAAKANITVENLLTMTSGIEWEEDVTEYGLDSNFVQSILNLPQAAAPGTTFNYSTGGAHLLGAVLAEATGQSLHQFGKTRLFQPLGIDVERWGRDNQGYFSGGFNFFLTPREMAAFGQLILDDGVANGQQIVPADWIAAATSAQGEVDYYGYMWWNDVNLAGHRGFRAWGWGKQFIYVFPTLEMVVAITHDTNGNVADTDLNNFVRNYVIGAVVGPPAPELPGDFNFDGRVDAVDYSVWRNGLGTNYDASDYDVWKQNYGRTATGSGGIALVPEPTGMVLILAGTVVLGLSSRSGRRRAACSALFP
jgi:CubicO group peptidase (beta-lactamase class C family)